jgi:hypothetical protein
MSNWQYNDVMEEEVRLTLRLPESLQKAIAELAARENRSINRQVVTMLSRAIEAEGVKVKQEQAGRESAS